MQKSMGVTRCQKSTPAFTAPPSTPDNHPMKNLRPETLGIVQRVEALSGCPVEFQPDSSLSIQATRLRHFPAIFRPFVQVGSF